MDTLDDDSFEFHDEIRMELNEVKYLLESIASLNRTRSYQIEHLTKEVQILRERMDSPKSLCTRFREFFSCSN